MLGRLAAPGQRVTELRDIRPILAKRLQPQEKRTRPVDASLFEIGPDALDGPCADLAKQLARPAVAALCDHRATGDVHCFLDISIIQGLLGLADSVLGLQPGRRQLLADQLRPAIAGGRLIQNPPADGEPAVFNVLFCLLDPQRVVLPGLLVLDNGVADSRTKLGNLRQGPGKLLRLVAVGQCRLEAVAGQVLLPSLHQRPGEPADELLTVTVPSNLVRLGDLESLIEPAVCQRTFRLSDSQD